MVNNQTKAGVPLALLLFSFLLFAFSVENLFAQKISKCFVSSDLPDGRLYFIKPMKGFANGGNDLVFDITYKSKKDSIVFTFTYFDKKELDIDSLLFALGNKIVCCPAKKLYVDVSKSKWEYRYSANLLFSDLSAFFDQENPPKLVVAAHKEHVELHIKNKMWEKQSSIVRKIFKLIKYN